MSLRGTDPLAPGDDLPAVVHDYSDASGRRAAVTHPFGPEHDNARRARARLMARGYTIVPLRPLTAARRAS